MSLVSGILTAAELASSIASMTSVIPSPPKALTDKHRWVTVTIFNQTQYSVLYMGRTYFDSGRFWDAPTNVEAFKSMTFSGCNSDDTFFTTGVAGGASFQVQLSQNDAQPISIGFTNPAVGSLKASAVLSSDPKAAYDAASNGSMAVTSGKFNGQDTKGDTTIIEFFVVAAPGQEASITITEKITSGGK